MSTETITIRLEAEAARAFNAAPEEERRKLEALLSLWLLEATRTGESLKEIMREISRNAQPDAPDPEGDPYVQWGSHVEKSHIGVRS